VTYAQLIAGHEPNVAFGIAHWSTTGVDDEFMGMLRFDRGSTASIYASFRADYRTWLEVLGTTGALTVPNPFRPGPMETLELERGGTVERIAVAGSPLIFVREIENFEARVLDGAPAVVTLAESRQTAATLVALYQSAIAGTSATETRRLGG
jgi:predicted dehydrogenase